MSLFLIKFFFNYIFYVLNPANRRRKLGLVREIQIGKQTSQISNDYLLFTVLPLIYITGLSFPMVSTSRKEVNSLWLAKSMAKIPNLRIVFLISGTSDIPLQGQ
jgi:hypothetical protein